jgi:GT2 family glycosyltransferase
MDVETTQLPPVVAAMVVHDPGPWFDDVLASLRVQDYGNLRRLFLLVDGPHVPETTERIRRAVPGSVLRTLPGNPGFGRAMNEVLRLVEGDNGFFLLLHDDVALDPSAVRLLVEELYRSNAGIVGPKLVSWNDPTVLQHVGVAVDHLAAVDPLVEPGERDQEQHDAVRDVFALPSACLLVRADLFRALGGFDPAIDFHGEDLDLCWRAHLSGARVVVVPAARARHREALVERRPELPHTMLRARHRMRAYATLTGFGRALLWLPVLIVTTLAELVTGVLRGKPAEGWAVTRALAGLVPRIGSITVRRAQLRSLRLVPEREVADLQMRGSARRAAYRRARDAAALLDDEIEAAPRERSSAITTVVWIAVLLLAILGGRTLIRGGVNPVGQMLPYPDAAGDLWREFRSGWWATGLGQPAAHPTAYALASVLNVVTFGNPGLAHTIGVIGLLPIGYLGFWRLAGAMPNARSRLVGLVVYAAVPLPYASIAAGRWSALAVYAALPWALYLAHAVTGIRSRYVVGYPGSGMTTIDLEDVVGVPIRRRIRLLGALALLVAGTAAFEPSFVLLVVLAAALWAVASAAVRSHPTVALFGLAATALAALVGLVANMPWALRYFDRGGWDAIVGPDLASPRDLGVVRLARFGVGPSTIGVLALALYVPVLLAPLVSKGWRLPWSARALFLVVPFGALAVLDDRGSIGLRLPEPAVLLAPVAVGVAIAAGVMVAVFASDVQAAGFGWRQPVGLLGVVAVVIGIVPGIGGAFDGAFSQPSVTLADALDNQMPADPPEGDYRVLYLGNPQVMPVASWTFRTGMAYALVDDGHLDVRADWAGPPVLEDRVLRPAVEAAASQTTTRVGRLLAPLGVRYIVVPLIDRVASTTSDPLPAPTGLLDALGDQLDLERVSAPSEVVVYENTAWLPTYSMLAGDAVTASQEAGANAIVRFDVSGQAPVFVGADPARPITGAVPAGLLNTSMRADPRWRLTIDGNEVPATQTFGFSRAYQVPADGTATLEYRTPGTRSLWIGLQVLLWLGLLAVAVDVLPRQLGRRLRVATEGPGDTTTLDLTDDWQAPGGPLFADDAADRPDVDATTQLRRPPLDELDRDATRQLRRIEPDEPDGGAP